MGAPQEAVSVRSLKALQEARSGLEGGGVGKKLLSFFKKASAVFQMTIHSELNRVYDKPQRHPFAEYRRHPIMLFCGLHDEIAGLLAVEHIRGIEGIDIQSRLLMVAVEANDAWVKLPSKAHQFDPRAILPVID